MPPPATGPTWSCSGCRNGLECSAATWPRRGACRMRRTRCWPQSSRTRSAAAMWPQVLSVRRPAQIVNYRSMGTTPVLLAGGLFALAAVVALGLALVASVRRCRRDACPAQGARVHTAPARCDRCLDASFAAAVGVVVGIPLGVVGRTLALDPLCRGDRRGAGPYGASVVGVPGPRWPLSSWRTLPPFSRSTRRSHRGGARPARRVTRRGRRQAIIVGLAPAPAQCRRSGW